MGTLYSNGIPVSGSASKTNQIGQTVTQAFYDMQKSILMANGYSQSQAETTLTNYGIVVGNEMTQEVFNSLVGDELTQINSNFTDELSAKQNSTDNALATTSKTVVGAINEINSNLNKNNSLTTAVMLTKDVAYTCPSDGYLIVSIRYGHVGESVVGYIGAQSISSVIGERSNTRLLSTFVRKGMSIKFTDTGTYGNGLFLPIV